MSEIGFSPVSIHPWDEIKYKLIQDFDTDEVMRFEFMNLSSQKIGLDANQEMKGSGYFKILEQKFEHCDLIEFFINLTNYTNLHQEYTRVANVLMTYRDDLNRHKRDLRERGMWDDKHFVGREEEIKKVLECIQGPNSCCRGVSLCGMGGMGKTSLANEICIRLHRNNWNILKIDMREQKSMRDLVRTTLTKLGEALQISSEEYTSEGKVNVDMNNMQALLIQRCCEETKDTVFWFDNVDGIIENEERNFLSFLNDFVTIVSDMVNSGTKVHKTYPLFTSRRELLTLRSKSIVLKQYSLASNSGDLMEVKVEPLSETHAVELFKRYTKKIDQVPDHARTAVLKFCGNCPLAITSLCSILGDVKWDSLLSTFHQTSPNNTLDDILPVDRCIKSSFEVLKPNHQQTLVQLSLFRTAAFDVEDATAILGRTKRTGKDETRLELHYLKSRHLIEFSDEEFISKWRQHYSLHPVVYRYLRKLETSQYRLPEAKARFITHFDERINKFAKELRTDVNARSYVFENKVHIDTFYNLLIETPLYRKEQQPEVTSRKERPSDVASVIQDMRKEELASLILSEHSRIDFYKTMIYHAKEDQNTEEEIMYQTRLATLYFDMDRKEKCELLLQEIDGNIKLLDDEKTTAVLVWASFLWIQGRFFNVSKKYQQALKTLELALKLFKHNKETEKRCIVEIANVHNTIGVVYYNMREFDKAYQYHTKALEYSDKEKSVSDDKQIYLTNIATALMSKWHNQEHSPNAEDSDSKNLLKKAETYYSNAILLDDRRSESRAKKLSNRGKCYMKLQKFDQAEEDFQESLQIRKSVLIPPNVNLTHGYYDIGYFYFVRGGATIQDDKAKGLECFLKARDYFEQIQKQIRIGGLEQTDDLYKTILKRHKIILRSINKGEELERVEQFYRDFEAGKFKKTIKKMRSIEMTRQSSQHLESTGQSIDEETSDNEKTDGSSSDSSDVPLSPSSSSDSDNENTHEKVPQDGAIIDRNKIDSGLGSSIASSFGRSIGLSLSDSVSSKPKLASFDSDIAEEDVFVDASLKGLENQDSEKNPMTTINLPPLNKRKISQDEKKSTLKRQKSFDIP